MPVKYWSAGGIVLTYRCNAACASCYLACGPDRPDGISVDRALEVWGQLIAASPHGCRVHLTGGEPFLDYPALLALCRRARAEGLGPLQKIETNAFWAVDPAVAVDRVAALADAGMEKLTLSAAPYHQQFVPIERCRLLARTAEDRLGPDRVQVRWRDWLVDGFDTAELPLARRDELFVRYAAGGRDRLSGRAADRLAGHLPAKPLRHFADKNCRNAILRSKHVHADPAGRVMPGTCAGIVLGTAHAETIGDIWTRLGRDHASRPVVGALASGGPVALLELASRCGFTPRPAGYAGPCHLCWDVRRHLAARAEFRAELAPEWMYVPDDPDR